MSGGCCSASLSAVRRREHIHCAGAVLTPELSSEALIRTIHGKGSTHQSCQHIYLGTLGRTHAANLILAEAIRLSHILGLHDERMVRDNPDVIEREMRRRVFWLLCGLFVPIFEWSIKMLTPPRRLRPDYHSTDSRPNAHIRRRPVSPPPPLSGRQPPNSLWRISAARGGHPRSRWIPL